MKNILSRSTFIVHQKEVYINSPVLLLAVSGGQDSIFLLILLKHLEKIHKLTLKLVYCNHFWQKKNFYIEIELLKISYLFNFSLNISLSESKIPNEEAGHFWRQKNFYQLGTFLSSKVLLMGHTASDEIETALWHFFRGSSPNGLISLDSTTMIKKNVLENHMSSFHFYQKNLKKKFIKFKYTNTYFKLQTTNNWKFNLNFLFQTKTNNLKPIFYFYGFLMLDFNNLIIKRPLFSFYRSEISLGIREKNLPIFIDQTNQSFKLIRNKIRLLILPFIRFYIKSSVDSHIKQYLQISRNEQNFLNKKQFQILNLYCLNPHSINTLTCYSIALQSRCLKFLVEKYTSRQIHSSQIKQFQIFLKKIQ